MIEKAFGQNLINYIKFGSLKTAEDYYFMVAVALFPIQMQEEERVDYLREQSEIIVATFNQDISICDPLNVGIAAFKWMIEISEKTDFI